MFHFAFKRAKEILGGYVILKPNWNNRWNVADTFMNDLRISFDILEDLLCHCNGSGLGLKDEAPNHDFIISVSSST